MKFRVLLFAVVFFIPFSSTYGQFYNNFEVENDLFVELDSSNINNIWTIGSPDKEIFQSANSMPNAIYTDSVDYYPINDTSSFVIRMPLNYYFNAFPYFVFHWNQKMDVELGKDGGMIEVSYDEGQEWININQDTFINPILLSNTTIDTLFNGNLGFSKTDSDWKEIGYCWQNSNYNYSTIDFLMLRFTFFSDSVDTNQEGWMIDDFQGYFTIVDQVNEQRNVQLENIKIFPNPVSSELNIMLDQALQYPIIYEIANLTGNVVLKGEFNDNEKFNIDMNKLSNGHYFLLLKDEIGKVIHSEKLTKIGIN